MADLLVEIPTAETRADPVRRGKPFTVYLIYVTSSMGELTLYRRYSGFFFIFIFFFFGGYVETLYPGVVGWVGGWRVAWLTRHGEGWGLAVVSLADGEETDRNVCFFFFFFFL